MRTLLIFFCCALVYFSSCSKAADQGNYYHHCPPEFKSEPINGPIVNPGNGVSKLALTMLHDLNKFAGKHYNIIISPVSIWMVLAMLLEGATGKTEIELKKKLQLPYKPREKGRADAMLIYNAMRRLYPENNGVTQFTSLNFMAFHKMLKINLQYKNLIREVYQGASFHIDQKKVKYATCKINNWAKAASKNRIKVLVSPDMLTDAVLVVGNAVYFKSKWASLFQRSRTSLMMFKDDTGKPIKDVPMMKQNLRAPCQDNSRLNSRVIELPYADNATSMVFILPNKGTPLRHVISKMTSMSLDQIAPKNMVINTVDLSLPRFHLQSKVYLNQFLSKDLPTTFSAQQADFSGISKSIYVNAIIHQTEIEVNEEGTTASAVTVAQLFIKSRGMKFIADRPFIYLVINRNYRNILFAGTFANPNKTFT